MKKLVYLFIAAAVLWACKPTSPSVYRGLPKEYTSAWEERYGYCYDSVPYAVVALDLYSEGVSLDSRHRITGTGYNLYISDIFVEGSTGQLRPGTYRSDTTATPYTFLPGHDYEGTPHGIYLLQIENSKVQSIQVIDSGTVVVRDTTNGLKDLQFTLYYLSAYGYKATYTTHFQGELVPWEKK